MRITTGKGRSKQAVPRHRTQCRSASDRQERAIEKQVRQESARLARSYIRAERCELDGHEGSPTCLHCGCPITQED